MATVAADRHLLFGLLALQNGLIDQGALVAAFQAWTRDKARGLADQLVARGDLDPDDRSAVDALVARHIKKHGGDVEKSLAAVPANRSARASLAALGEPEIEATLARVTRNNNCHATEADNDPDRTASVALGGSTSDGQRFRLLRPHARGGLGEVFVALDAELHREVALKQILEKHADDPVNRQRFVAEAEITGALEHPGVVPVYGMGTYGGGRPYYAMRFINGDSLKEAVEHLHGDETVKDNPGRRLLELRKLLRRFLDVCNAIDYAHSRGVIHRDIKPANIILGKHGETLVVDWGLAKAIGRADPSVGEQTIAPSSSGSSETLPGSALGTPAYMSPEQAAGELDHLGPRSDAYGLGATLYYLLTGKPPQEGDDVGELLRRVQRGDFRRPRQLDPSLDRALEAVCLKAMAIDPAERYASCRALAEDVERWMADQPVSAWAEPWTRTLVRWLTRHRTGVTGLAATLLAGVVGLSAVLAVQTQANAQLSASLNREKAVSRELVASNQELARAKTAVQARYDLAVDAIKTFHTGVSEDFLLKQDQFKELRDRLLKSAADFYGKLGALLGKETDVASRRALAQSNFELAELADTVGRAEEALAAHRAVLAAREALAGEPEADAPAQLDIGRSLTAVASLLEATGKTDEALGTYRRSESLLEGLAANDPAARAALAACRERMGRLLYRRKGRHAEALAAYRLARDDQEALVAAPGASNDTRYNLALTITRLSALLWETDTPSEAEAEIRKGIAIGKKLVDDNPDVTQYRHLLAQSRSNLGIVLRDTGRQAEAEAQYREAMALFQKLADDNPAVTDFRRGMSYALNNLAAVVSSLGRAAEARNDYDRAIALKERLVREQPTNPEYRMALAESLRRRGLTRRDLGDAAGAVADARRALRLYEALPSRRGWEWFETACCHAALAATAGRDGTGVSAAEAEDEAARAIAALTRAVGMGHRNADAWRRESALDPLRLRDDFRLLMMDVAFPAEPFATTR
jgi:serine/threonine-protein kinase